jgi:hypothetical protein
MNGGAAPEARLSSSEQLRSDAVRNDPFGPVNNNE